MVYGGMEEATKAGEGVVDATVFEKVNKCLCPTGTRAYGQDTRCGPLMRSALIRNAVIIQNEHLNCYSL